MTLGRGYESRLCICYSEGWLSLVLQLMLLLAYFTVSVSLVWYRLPRMAVRYDTPEF